MLLRKINAVLSHIITFLLMDHAIFNAIRMLFAGRIESTFNYAPWILAVLMLIHAALCIYFGISAHKNAEKGEFKGYPKLNAPALLQRISGVLLIVFTALHIAGAAGALVPPRAVQAILSPLFFTVALAHVAVSTSKAFITLGIGNALFIKVVDIVIKVMCAITLAASITGFYITVFAGG
jgi:hypothetical protein